MALGGVAADADAAGGGLVEAAAEDCDGEAGCPERAGQGDRDSLGGIPEAVCVRTNRYIAEGKTEAAIATSRLGCHHVRAIFELHRQPRGGPAFQGEECFAGDVVGAAAAAVAVEGVVFVNQVDQVEASRHHICAGAVAITQQASGRLDAGYVAEAIKHAASFAVAQVGGGLAK